MGPNSLYDALKDMTDEHKVVDVTELVTRKFDIPSNTVTLAAGKLVLKKYCFNKLEDPEAKRYFLSVPGLDFNELVQWYKHRKLSIPVFDESHID